MPREPRAMERTENRRSSRRAFLIAAGAWLALARAGASFAQQQPAKVARIGFLGTESASGFTSRVETLRAGLRELGYVEGKNIIIEFRWAEGKNDRLPELAAELVRLNVDVIVIHATPGTLAAKRATTTIPIVTASMGDALAVGVVSSLARPGGNITGSTYFQPELMAKRIELLNDAMPRLTQVAVLTNPDNSMTGPILQAMEVTARSLNVALHRFEVREPSELEGAFAAMAKRRVDAVVIHEDPRFVVNAKKIADLAAKQRLPSIGFGEFTEAGGLIAYGVNFLELYRRAAYFVDRILKGAKPGDLPIERATRFELVINRKTAKALKLTIPQQLLVRADKIIE